MKEIAIFAMVSALVVCVGWGQVCSTPSFPTANAVFYRVEDVLKEVAQRTPNGGSMKIEYAINTTATYGQGQCKAFGSQKECGACLVGLADGLIKSCPDFLDGYNVQPDSCFLRFARAI